MKLIGNPTYKPLSVSSEPLFYSEGPPSTRPQCANVRRAILLGGLVLIGFVLLGVAFMMVSCKGKTVFDESSPTYKAFVDFEQKFNKEWKDLEERLFRYEIFIKNFYQVRHLNRQAALDRKNTSFEINEFADWTDEEIKQSLLPVHFYKNLRANRLNPFASPINPIFENITADGNYPAHFDWREKGVVTPVKNQGKCGSCWAFATAATVECAHAIAHTELLSLSEQELLDCNLENNACNGGDVDKAFRFVHRNGLMEEDAYPYVAHRQNGCSIVRNETTKIEVAYFINPDERSIIDWLVNFGPVNIGIAVPPDMKPWKSGVYTPSDYDCQFRILGLHALLIVGYGTTDEGEKYWIVKNSWGQAWGVEQGYVYFARGVNACGIEDEPIGLLG